jgi:hypothetical protein
MQIDRRFIKIKSRTVSRSTPIPPRASAHPEAVVKVQHGYFRAYRVPTSDDTTRLTADPAQDSWQHKTSYDAAESGPASSSLLTPQPLLNQSVVVASSIDVLDTLPSVASVQRQEKPENSATLARDLADVDTVPPAIAQARAKQDFTMADIPTVPPDARHVSATRRNPSSLASQPPYATDYELFQAASGEDELSLRFDLFDRCRWWLLYPGRLETLLWSAGTVLLVGITVLLSVISVLSLTASHVNQVDSGHGSTLSGATSTFCSVSPQAGSGTQKCVIATAASPDGLQISLFSHGLFVTGATVHLEGHGFSPLGRVIITHDANLPCQPGTVQVDQHGDFSLVLSLPRNLGWQPGNHALVVEDVASKHRVMLAFVLCASK